MGKKRPTNKRRRPAANNTTGDNANNSNGDLDQQSSSDLDGGGGGGWSSIPGKRLDIDLKESPPSNDIDEFDTSKWTSRHYDNNNGNDDDDAAHHHEEAQFDNEDLYNPDPLDNTNRFDSEFGLEGANDAGMFLR